MCNRLFSALIFLLSCFVLRAQQQSILLSPEEDCSIYTGAFEDGSNATGHYLDVGSDKGYQARSLLKFDVSIIPANVVVDSVKLLLQCNANPKDAHLSLWPLSSSWHCGTSSGHGSFHPVKSELGEVSWNYRSQGNDIWIQPGGDYNNHCPTVSTLQGSKISFSSAHLTNAVEDWITVPERNHGWLITMDSSSNTNHIGFASMETNEAPKLQVHYRIIKSSDVDQARFKYENSMAHPNPFFERTRITYELPTQSAHVEIKVFNTYGAKIKTLYNGPQGKGGHRIEWNGTGEDDIEVASGFYYYTIVSDNLKGFGKLVLR
jgi:hypothetical protein